MQDSLQYLGPILPASVAVVFPQLCGSAIPLDGEHVITVALADLAEFSPLRGYTGTKTFRDRTWARLRIPARVIGQPDDALELLDTTPLNLADLTLLATRIARDYYRWQCGVMDRKFVGALAWDHEGLSDEVEYTHAAMPGGQLEVATRVQRGTWNGHPEELLHQLGDEVDTVFPFKAIILDAEEGGYHWQYLAAYEGGVFNKEPGSHRGPRNEDILAYEENDNPDVPYGTMVRMWPHPGGCAFQFAYCCAGGQGSGSGRGPLCIDVIRDVSFVDCQLIVQKVTICFPVSAGVFVLDERGQLLPGGNEDDQTEGDDCQVPATFYLTITGNIPATGPFSDAQVGDNIVFTEAIPGAWVGSLSTVPSIPPGNPGTTAADISGNEGETTGLSIKLLSTVNGQTGALQAAINCDQMQFAPFFFNSDTTSPSFVLNG